MVLKVLNYQILVKRLVTVPTLIIVVVCLIIYGVLDLTQTIKHQIKDAHLNNQLIASTASFSNNNLLTQQVTILLRQSPQIKAITFFSFSDQQNPTVYPLQIRGIFFDHYYGLSEPVKIALSQTQTNQNEDAQVSQLIGYMNLTLDLQHMRRQWLLDNLPLFSIIILVNLLSLIIVLQKLQTLTGRLPKLECLSQDILKDEFTEIEHYPLPKNSKDSWIFEKALVHLLTKHKKQTFQLELMQQEKTALEQTQLKQIEQSSKFENILVHELKTSVNRIETGVQLLESQYASAEQQDAIEIINLGKDDLNIKLNQIIQINRIDKGQTGISHYPFSPSMLITQIVAEYQAIASQKQLLLTAKTYHANYILEGDIQKISLVIRSLLENALKFTSKGSIILTSQLQHLTGNIRWIIEVQDTGCGIAPQYYQQIFEPFFQIDPEIKHTLSANTVGLFLVKKLVSLMNGSIEVNSQINKGTTFRFSLTLKDAKNDNQTTLLEHKKMVIWDRFEDLVEKTQRLRHLGAAVDLFTDAELLMDHLLNHAVDALLISRHIEAPEVLAFMTQLRAMEQQQRVIAIYFYDAKTISAHTAELLKISGIDYLEEKTVLDEDIGNYLKKLANILLV